MYRGRFTLIEDDIGLRLIGVALVDRKVVARGRCVSDQLIRRVQEVVGELVDGAGQAVEHVPAVRRTDLNSGLVNEINDQGSVAQIRPGPWWVVAGNVAPAHHRQFRILQHVVGHVVERLPP